MSRIFIFVLFFLNSCSTPSQWYWDHKVKELCEKDGGVTVYERVALSSEEYEKNDGANGTIRVMPEITSDKKYDYAYKIKTVIINKEDPYVWRSEYTIYRKSDMKELGIMIDYSRRGGDFPTGISHPSSFGCNEAIGVKNDFVKEVFTFKGE